MEERREPGALCRVERGGAHHDQRPGLARREFVLAREYRLQPIEQPRRVRHQLRRHWNELCGELRRGGQERRNPQRGAPRERELETGTLVSALRRWGRQSMLEGAFQLYMLRRTGPWQREWRSWHWRRAWLFYPPPERLCPLLLCVGDDVAASWTAVSWRAVPWRRVSWWREQYSRGED